MRRKKCLIFGLLSGVLSLLLQSILLVADTSAYNYFDSGTYTLDATNSRLYTSSNNFGFASVGGGGLIASYPSQLAPSYDSITSLHLCINSSNAIQNALYYFNITFVDNTGSSTVYSPLALQTTGYYHNMISTTYGEYGRASYVFYYQKGMESPVTCFDFRVDGNQSMWGVYSRIDISSFSWVQLQDGVSAEQIDEYAPEMINLLQELVDNASSSAEAEMNEKDNQDRSDIQSQQSSVDSGADSSQDSAESTGTTLLVAFSSFVSAITSARPSNCNINMDMGNLDLGVVNFCQLSPPPEFQTLASIFMILFCVPLSVATARKVINLFRSFQS